MIVILQITAILFARAESWSSLANWSVVDALYFYRSIFVPLFGICQVFSTAEEDDLMALLKHVYNIPNIVCSGTFDGQHINRQFSLVEAIQK